jgi:hypothetical protein
MGVLLQLYIKNWLCPYCIKSEDRNAYQAVRSIQTTCRYVVQYPTQTSSSSSSNETTNAGNFLKSLFGGSSNGSSRSSIMSLSNTSKGAGQPIRASLVLQDSDIDGQPILRIVPMNHQENGGAHRYNDDDDIDKSIGNASENGASDTATATTAIVVKLRRVDRIQLEGEQIVLYAKSRSGNSNTPTKTTPQELLRFAVVLPSYDGECHPDSLSSPQSTTTTTTTTTTSVDAAHSTKPMFLPTDARNMLIHHWMVLVEWERQRRIQVVQNSISMPPDEDDESDDDHDDGVGTPNFLVVRAQKAAHFAQREIELQRTKREREQRKAKLIQEAGGLKYTAIAMANNKK